MLQIEIEYMMEEGPMARCYGGEPMVPGRGYWFGVYWRLRHEEGAACLAKVCSSYHEAVDYAERMRELPSFRSAEVVDHARVWADCRAGV